MRLPQVRPLLETYRTWFSTHHTPPELLDKRHGRPAGARLPTNVARRNLSESFRPPSLPVYCSSVQGCWAWADCSGARITRTTISFLLPTAKKARSRPRLFCLYRQLQASSMKV